MVRRPWHSMPQSSAIQLLTMLPGEIYKLNLAGRTVIPVSSYALVNELCDEKRFKKDIRGVLSQVREGVHDGLFTASGPDEENWGIARTFP